MEAQLLQSGAMVNFVADAAYSAGAVVQLRDGRAGIVSVDVASGDTVGCHVTGQFTVVKTTGMVFLAGGGVYWDHSANAAHYKTGGDRDFYLGTVVSDVASTVLTAVVDLNAEPEYVIDLLRDPGISVTVKTVVGSITVEVPHLEMRGGSAHFILGATAEAQKVDLLSQESFAPGAKWILEGIFCAVEDGDAGAIDANFGVANATHASDADSITESCFIHLDGNAVDVLAESDDGATEVNAVDTTINYTLGTPVHFWMDGRNLADIQIYINGSLVLGATVFKLDAAIGPFKLLAHLEKTADDTTGDYRLDMLRVRQAQV